MGDVPQTRLLRELAAAVLAHNSIVRVLLVLGLLLSRDTIAISLLLAISPDALPQLHALKFPFRYFASSLRFRHKLDFLLLPLLFRIVVFFNAFAARISCFSMLCNIEFLALFNENFLTYFTVLDDCLLVELAAAIVAREQTAHISVFRWLIKVLLRP